MRAFFCFAGATAEVVFFQPQAGVYQTAMAPALPSPVAYEPANFPQAVVVGQPAARSGPGPVAAVLMGLVAGVAVSKVRSLFAVEGVETSSSGEGLDFKMSFTKDGKAISPWHDIPAMDGDMVNFICEIPKYGLAKMECDTKGENNPIVQDEKGGKPRFYHGKIFWNYGFVPQTWENPGEKDKATDCFGDGDPLDVVEIGSSSLEMGSITSVKPLGALAMIDGRAADLNDVEGIPVAEAIGGLVLLTRILPGLRHETVVPEDLPVVEARLSPLLILDDRVVLALRVALHLCQPALRDFADEVHHIPIHRRDIVPRGDGLSVLGEAHLEVQTLAARTRLHALDREQRAHLRHRHAGHEAHQHGGNRPGPGARGRLSDDDSLREICRLVRNRRGQGRRHRSLVNTRLRLEENDFRGRPGKAEECAH